MNLLTKLPEIIDGWKNWMFRKATIEELAAERLRICRLNTCGFYVTKPYAGCSLCGCPEQKKVRSLKTRCDEGYWDYAHTIKLQITERLLDDLVGINKKKEGSTYIYTRKGVKVVFNFITHKASLPEYSDKQCEFWNELYDIYFFNTGKKFF